MSFKDKLLYHQIHPLKLSTDIASGYGALWFYWQHQFLLGLAVTFVPPVFASFVTIRFLDVEKLRTSKLGTYMQKHMTQSLSLLRFMGNFIMLSGAWYHNWWIIILGTLWIAACWVWGMGLDWFARKHS